jgi:hypothetical protein
LENPEQDVTKDFSQLPRSSPTRKWDPLTLTQRGHQTETKANVSLQERKNISEWKASKMKMHKRCRVGVLKTKGTKPETLKQRIVPVMMMRMDML